VEVDALPQEEQQKVLAEVEKLAGRRAFPVTVIGDSVILGFKPDEFARALKESG